MEQPKSPATPKQLIQNQHTTTHISPPNGNLLHVATVQHYEHKAQLTEPDKECQRLAQCRSAHQMVALAPPLCLKNTNGHIANSDHIPYPDDVAEPSASNKHQEIAARNQTLHTILALLDALHVLTTRILQLVFQPTHRSAHPGYSQNPLTHLTQSQTTLQPQQISLRNPVTTLPLTLCQSKKVNTSTQPQIPIWLPPKLYVPSTPALLTPHLKHVRFKTHAPHSCIKSQSWPHDM